MTNFATLNFDSFSTRVCLIFNRWLFSSKMELFGWTDLKKTPWRTKILIYPVWNKILKIWDTLFELIQIELQCSKNYFNFFITKSWNFCKQHRKGAAKVLPKIEKIWNIYREYLLCLESNANVISLQTCINFVEQWLKVSQFKVA